MIIILKVQIYLILGLINETYFCMSYLNDNFTPNCIDSLTKVYIENVFTVQDNNELVEKVYECLLEFEVFKATNRNRLIHEAKKVLKALFTIREFLDRGMKGFLTGDISFNLISQAKFVFRKYLDELKIIEESFIKKKIDPFDFYESYFKIDKKYFEMNANKDLVVNLAGAEQEGVVRMDIKYHIDLKTMTFKEKYEKLTGLRDSANEILEIKTKVEGIINNLYNEIESVCFDNKLRTPVNGIPFPSKENNYNLFRRQLVVEQGSFEDASEEYLKMLESLNDMGKLENLSINRKIIQGWNKVLIICVSEAQKNLLSRKKLKQSDQYLTYLLAMPSRSVSIVALVYLIRRIIEHTTARDYKAEENQFEFLNILEGGEESIDVKIPLQTFCEDLGQLLALELKNTQLENTVKDKDARIYIKSLAENLVSYEITKEDKIKLGHFVTNLMIKHLTFMPISQTINQERVNLLECVNRKIDSTRSQNFIKFNSNFLHEYYLELHKKHALETQIKKSLPMIYKPLPWKSFKIGSYYLRQSPFAKVMPAFHEATMLFDTNNISTIANVLDKLGSIKWRVNKRILDVMEYIWANGGGKAMIPKKYNERLISKEMIKNTKTFKEKTILLKEAQSNREAHSLRCDFGIKMKVAKEFKNIAEFYYPHNMDYRGRVYPISPHLNHMGSDVNRGLLEYAEGKPLGKTGLRWLKVIYKVM
jgi:DNA-directed RNA polymerase